MTPLVLLDLDDTLVDRAAAFGRWAEQFCGDHRLAHDAASWLEAADRDGHADRVTFFADVCRRFGIDDEAFAADWARNFSAFFELDPGVAGGLKTLRAEGWRAALVTNGGTEVQTAKILQVGLDQLVDGWAISEAVGVAKPDPRILEAAAAAVGEKLAPSNWIIGNSAQYDIQAAHRAGIRSIWLTRGRAWSEREFRPALMAESAAGALALVTGQPRTS